MITYNFKKNYKENKLFCIMSLFKRTFILAINENIKAKVIYESEQKQKKNTYLTFCF